MWLRFWNKCWSKCWRAGAAVCLFLLVVAMVLWIGWPVGSPLLVAAARHSMAAQPGLTDKPLAGSVAHGNMPDNCTDRCHDMPQQVQRVQDELKAHIALHAQLRAEEMPERLVRMEAQAEHLKEMQDYIIRLLAALFGLFVTVMGGKAWYDRRAYRRIALDMTHTVELTATQTAKAVLAVLRQNYGDGGEAKEVE